MTVSRLPLHVSCASLWPDSGVLCKKAVWVFERESQKINQSRAAFAAIFYFKLHGRSHSFNQNLDNVISMSTGYPSYTNGFKMRQSRFSFRSSLLSCLHK